MDESWLDPTAAWWAKAARALRHVQDVQAMVAEFERSMPYEVRSEAGDRPNEVAFRLHVFEPVPVELLTTVGDMLHNMRSCLDSVAYELARRHLGDTMTVEQEQATQFPICPNRGMFESFFERNRHRRAMYGQQERDALRCVQPFALREEATSLGVDVKTSTEYEYLTDELSRLHALSNVDKHRRLPLLTWYPDIIHWTKPDGDPGYTWRPAQPPSANVDDRTVIGYLVNRPGNGPPAGRATIELRLTLMDDPAFPDDLVTVLERWHSYLVGWVLPTRSNRRPAGAPGDGSWLRSRIARCVIPPRTTH